MRLVIFLCVAVSVGAHMEPGAKFLKSFPPLATELWKSVGPVIERLLEDDFDANVVGRAVAFIPRTRDESKLGFLRMVASAFAAKNPKVPRILQSSPYSPPSRGAVDSSKRLKYWEDGMVAEHIRIFLSQVDLKFESTVLHSDAFAEFKQVIPEIAVALLNIEECWLYRIFSEVLDELCPNAVSHRYTHSEDREKMEPDEEDERLSFTVACRVLDPLTNSMHEILSMAVPSGDKTGLTVPFEQLAEERLRSMRKTDIDSYERRSGRHAKSGTVTQTTRLINRCEARTSITTTPMGRTEPRPHDYDDFQCPQNGQSAPGVCQRGLPCLYLARHCGEPGTSSVRCEVATSTLVHHSHRRGRAAVAHAANKQLAEDNAEDPERPSEEMAAVTVKLTRHSNGDPHCNPEGGVYVCGAPGSRFDAATSLAPAHCPGHGVQDMSVCPRQTPCRYAAECRGEDGAFECQVGGETVKVAAKGHSEVPEFVCRALAGSDYHLPVNAVNSKLKTENSVEKPKKKKRVRFAE